MPGPMGMTRALATRRKEGTETRLADLFGPAKIVFPFGHGVLQPAGRGESV